MTPTRLGMLCCLLVWLAPLSSPASFAAPSCRALSLPALTISGRIDTLLPEGSTELVAALVGRSNAPIAFLPHDRLVIVRAGDPAAVAYSIALPPYVTAPGLAAAPDGSRLYVFLDGTILTLDGSGRQLARQDLRMQAIGWPAAVAGGSNGSLYLVGQPTGDLAAQAYAYSSGRGAELLLRWRAPLGLTHAGTWVGLTGEGQPAIYAPDAHDVHGTVLLLDSTDGKLRASYNVTMPPSASDSALNRLYLAGTGVVRALDLRSGVPIATSDGDTPLAASTSEGLVAYVRGNRLQIARAGDLRPLLAVAFPGGIAPTALAWQGPQLLVGSAVGLKRLDLENCR